MSRLVPDLAASASQSEQRLPAHFPNGGLGFKHRLVSLFWFALVPAGIACVGTWLLAAGSTTNASEPGLDAWLRDQFLLVWLVVFLLCTALLSYWKPYLPPKRFWSNAPVQKTPLATREVARYGLLVLGSAGLALALRAWVAEPCKVRSASMMPTLYPGDLLLVRKPSPFNGSGHLPQRGRPILLDTPDPVIRELDSTLFKRVVGLPGDVLTVDRGAPVINGWRVPRCGVGRISLDLPSINAPMGGTLIMEWLGDSTYLTLVDGNPADGVQGPYTVKPAEVWVLGDNRNSSSDSRTWFGGKGGGVPLSGVLGSPTWTLFNSLGEGKLRMTRVEQPTLPANAQHLTPAFERCLARKPAQTWPPQPKPTTLGVP
jgi:signal peptidase I